MSSDRDQILHLLARYVRATDQRDGATHATLFTADCVTELYTRVGAEQELLGQPLRGPDAVKWATENLMQPHPPRGWSHHVTADHLIDVDGDTAQLNAQYIVFDVLGEAEPDGGWAAGAAGAQGAIRPIESGYYDSNLARVDGRWLFRHHRVVADLPFAIPRHP